MGAPELDDLVGLDVETARARADELPGAATVRVVRPGDLMTADYRTSRLNLLLDASDVVDEVSWG